VAMTMPEAIRLEVGTKRAPCMHDGSVATLREVVELYNNGGHPNGLDQPLTLARIAAPVDLSP